MTQTWGRTSSANPTPARATGTGRVLRRATTAATSSRAKPRVSGHTGRSTASTGVNPASDTAWTRTSNPSAAPAAQPSRSPPAGRVHPNADRSMPVRPRGMTTNPSTGSQTRLSRILGLNVPKYQETSGRSAMLAQTLSASSPQAQPSARAGQVRPRAKRKRKKGYINPIPATAATDICKPRSKTDRGDTKTMAASAKNRPSMSTRPRPWSRSSPQKPNMTAARINEADGCPSQA